MRAMVFAAGLGTRLGALTTHRPKALATVAGVPLLEIVLRRLRDAGVDAVVINVHHLADQVEAFVRRNNGFGLEYSFSREVELLDTGGGLKQASPFFRGAEAAPFLLHNVDVLSDVDLRAVCAAHVASGALATLVAKARPTARPLLFDAEGRLCGRRNKAGERIVREGPEPRQVLGFCGVHVVSPALLDRLTETGAFSIIDSYLRLAAEGANVRVFRVDHCRWRDAGRPEDLRPLD